MADRYECGLTESNPHVLGAGGGACLACPILWPRVGSITDLSLLKFRHRRVPAERPPPTAAGTRD